MMLPVLSPAPLSGRWNERCRQAPHSRGRYRPPFVAEQKVVDGVLPERLKERSSGTTSLGGLSSRSAPFPQGAVGATERAFLQYDRWLPRAFRLLRRHRPPPLWYGLPYLGTPPSGHR